LKAFIGERSQSAFAALVDRHGGLVMGVCRRILNHSQDAEDAFQATFLVLAQRANTLTGSRPLGPWLYEVARRVALKARKRRKPNSICATKMGSISEQRDEFEAMNLADMQPIIDEEIEHLPRLYRDALILCQLEGCTKVEAARSLGCPEGTVSSRLMRAKELLRSRLVRRGITLSSFFVLESVLAPAPVSAQLVQQTIQAALGLTAGATVAAGVVSPSVYSLMQGVSQAMVLTKLKLAFVGLVLAGGMTVGAGYVVGGWGPGQNQNPSKNPGQAAAVTSVSTQINPANPSQEKPKSGAEGSARRMITNSDELKQLLASPTNIFDKRFGEATTLSDNIDFIKKVHDVTCVVDMEAYRRASPDIKLEDLLQSQINMARMPGVNLDTIIHSMLEQLTVGGASLQSTYMVRNGHLFIVPKDFIVQAPDAMTVALDGKTQSLTLERALDQLSEETGVSIILDPRVDETAKNTVVRASIRNVKLLSAVRVLANMADLSVLDVDGALYVSTEENIAKYQRDVRGNEGTINVGPINPAPTVGPMPPAPGKGPGRKKSAPANIPGGSNPNAGK
jgi:RNA polymerase sigma factor (sigma-70 family)